jgi:hypothetical protein
MIRTAVIDVAVIDKPIDYINSPGGEREFGNYTAYDKDLGRYRLRMCVALL